MKRLARRRSRKSHPPPRDHSPHIPSAFIASPAMPCAMAVHRPLADPIATVATPVPNTSTSATRYLPAMARAALDASGRDRFVSAGLRVLHESGAAELTLRRVAQQAGSSTM